MVRRSVISAIVGALVVSGCANRPGEPLVCGPAAWALLIALSPVMLVTGAAPKSLPKPCPPDNQQSTAQAMNLETLNAAAENGDAEAQYQLAIRVWNPERRRLLVCKAAAQNHAAAQNFMAVQYAGGLDPYPRDLVQAYAWYEIAAMTPGAPVDQRPKLEKELTSEDIAKAKAMAATWQPGSCTL